MRVADGRNDGSHPSPVSGESGEVRAIGFAVDRWRGSLAVEWLAAAAVSVVSLRLFLSSDFLARAPAGDRGVFIACSKLIAGGAVMYRDVFDNKPPLIYLLGALAWRLSPEVRSVFVMERVALLLLAGVMFTMLRFSLGARLGPALIGLLVGLVALRNPDVFSGGHLTEEYGILFEVATVTCLGFALPAMRGVAGGVPWATAAGFCAALTLLTRQSFLASLAAIWIAFHAPLAREWRRAARLIAWQLAGFLLPMLAWVVYLWCVNGLTQYLELFSETSTFSSAYHGVGGVKHLAQELPYLAGSRDTFATKVVQGVLGMVRAVFANAPFRAAAAGIVALAAVFAGLLRMRRGTPPLRITPLLLPLWFAAELVAASTPGTHYAHYYIAFVPIWACAFALAAEILLPENISRETTAMARTAICLIVLTTGVITFYGSYRTNPTKSWFLFAPNLRLPPAIIQNVRDDAQRLGLRSYIPLDTQATGLLLDMPLPPGTRFLIQYFHQFPGPDSARGKELLADLARSDMVVDDRERSALDQRLEHAIAATLRADFAPQFEWSHFQFYVRRDHLRDPSTTVERTVGRPLKKRRL